MVIVWGVPLHDPGRHVALPACEWQPGRAREWLVRWSGEALAGWARDGAWAMHPRDAEAPDEPLTPKYSLYLGAGGVWLALARVAEAGLCRLDVALAEVLRGVLAAYLRSPDIGVNAPSWILGEAGLLTMCCRAAPDAALADRLAEVIRGNRDNPTREFLWGAPGTMAAALCMYESSQDARWAELFLDSADALWARWEFDAARGAWLWEQDMYGSRERYLGAGHGWVGNLHPLWRGQALLSAERREQLRERTLQGLTRLVMHDGELVNWPAAPGGKLLVQWCHGAPGFLTSLRHAALAEAEPLLRAAAELVWRAGPLVKGVALCHGTDGNGVALLAAYQRTGAAVWLARARQFAMWAIEQSEELHARHGQWRQSLWTGDAGLACFLVDCLDGESRGMPGLDSLW